MAFVPHDTETWLAIGVPGDLDGTGTVFLVMLEGDELVPQVRLVGQTADAPERFGSGLAGGWVGGQGMLAIGAEFSDGIGLDNGAVFFYNTQSSEEAR